MFMRLVHATSVAFFREKTNATEVACTGNAAQLFAGHNTGTAVPKVLTIVPEQTGKLFSQSGLGKSSGQSARWSR
jgi:geranylgeranyl pyrophosphate synthase